MFFEIVKSTDPKIVGKPSFHSDRMKVGYDYKKKNSVYNWKINDTPPDLDAILLNEGAKLTDLLTCVPIGGKGSLVSDKLLGILTKFSMMKHVSFEPVILQRDKQIDGYKYISFNQKLSDEHVRFDLSKYVYLKRNSDGLFVENGRAKINSFGDLYSKNPQVIRPRLKWIYLKPTFKFEVFPFKFSGQIIVTEKVKIACEQEGIKGITFKPVEYLKSD